MELIVIEKRIVGNEEINSVDARDLHSRLGVKKDFSDWIKGNIKKLNLIENVDFSVLPQKGENLSGGRPSLEYVLTLDAGKHIAMMTNTETAHAVRTYFIEFEKQAKKALSIPIDPILAIADALSMIRREQLNLETKTEVVSIGLIETRHDVNNLKQNMRIENWQQCNLKKAVDAKVQEFKELYPSINVSDTYRKVWRWFKNRFHIPRYNELPAMMYEDAIKATYKLAIHNLAGL